MNGKNRDEREEKHSDTSIALWSINNVTKGEAEIQHLQSDR